MAALCRKTNLGAVRSIVKKENTNTYMELTNKFTSTYVPCPEGVHNAVCVDLIDLGIVDTQWGDKHKLRIVFETEGKKDDGSPYTISKSFTASLNPKATLAQFLSKWRGKIIAEGETIDLSRLIGVSATLVVSHVTNDDGKTFANIDAVSKPTKKSAPSGSYDPAAARQRIAEFAAKQNGTPVRSDNDAVIASYPKSQKPAAKIEVEDNVPF